MSSNKPKVNKLVSSIRVDNTPNYQALQGKIARVRISARGIYPRADVRIEKIELETGIICVDNYRARGRKKTEELLPNLEADIKSLVEMYSQADPKFQSKPYHRTDLPWCKG